MQKSLEAERAKAAAAKAALAAQAAQDKAGDSTRFKAGASTKAQTKAAAATAAALAASVVRQQQLVAAAQGSIARLACSNAMPDTACLAYEEAGKCGEVFCPACSHAGQCDKTCGYCRPKNLLHLLNASVSSGFLLGPLRGADRSLDATAAARAAKGNGTIST